MSLMIEEHENVLRENMLLQSQLPPTDLTRRSGGRGPTFDLVAERTGERGRMAPGPTIGQPIIASTPATALIREDGRRGDGRCLGGYVQPSASESLETADATAGAVNAQPNGAWLKTADATAGAMNAQPNGAWLKTAHATAGAMNAQPNGAWLKTADAAAGAMNAQPNGAWIGTAGATAGAAQAVPLGASIAADTHPVGATGPGRSTHENVSILDSKNMSEQDSMDIALGLSILDQLRAGQTPTLPPGGRGLWAPVHP